MLEEERQEHQGPPLGILLAILIYTLVLAPYIFGNQEAITEAISELLSPLGLLLLPIILLLTIQFLSSDYVSFFSTGKPDSIHRVCGSAVGVALLLVLILFLLSYRASILGGGDDESGE